MVFLFFVYIRLFQDICKEFAMIECASSSYKALMSHTYWIGMEGVEIGEIEEILANPDASHGSNRHIIASYLNYVFPQIIQYDAGNICAASYLEKGRIKGKEVEGLTDPQAKLWAFEEGRDYLEQAAEHTRARLLKAQRYYELANYLMVFETLKTGEDYSLLLLDIVANMRLAYEFNPEAEDIRTSYGNALINYSRHTFGKGSYQDAKFYAFEATTFQWPDLESAYYELSRIQSYIPGEEVKAYGNALQALKILDEKYPPSGDAGLTDLNVITKKLNLINQVIITAEPISVEKKREMDNRKKVLDGGRDQI